TSQSSVPLHMPPRGTGVGFVTQTPFGPLLVSQRPVVHSSELSHSPPAATLGVKMSAQSGGEFVVSPQGRFATATMHAVHAASSNPSRPAATLCAMKGSRAASQNVR